jgi:hypothetical protein
MAVVGCLALISAGACGEDENPKLVRSQPVDRAAPVQRGQYEPAPQGGYAHSPIRESRRGRDSRPPASSRGIRTRSGAVVMTPPRPTKAAAQPNYGCVRDHRGVGTRRKIVWLPPRPGLRTVMRRQAITVSYAFRGSIERCIPTTLQITLDVNDDPLPGRSQYVRARHMEGRVTIPIPEDLDAADVVRVSAMTRRGVPGEAASVLISP